MNITKRNRRYMTFTRLTEMKADQDNDGVRCSEQMNCDIIVKLLHKH